MRTRRAKPQIVIKNGKPSAVILDIEAYREILERLKDAEDIRELEEMRKRPLEFVKLDDSLGTPRHGFPGIESSPDICGGEARIVRTRIPIWELEQARRLGSSEADILTSFPTLRAEDLATAWAYVRSHRDEIDRNIRENEEA